MEKRLRFGIVAGEESGDSLGAGLMQAILQKYPNSIFEGIGGPAMIELGCKSFYPMERLSVMGFIEPLGRLPELLRMARRIRQHFINNPPDAFIGIDSPGFNLQIEKTLHSHNIKTIHYVSPSVWAYGEKRIEKIKRAVGLMLVLFPFETSIYHANGIPVQFVGHPLADSIGLEDRKIAARQQLGIDSNVPVVALLPGSRSSEVSRLAGTFMATAKKLRETNPAMQFLMPCANTERRVQVQTLLQEQGYVSLVQLLDGDSQLAIAAADVVLLASGTATLETLLLKRPMVICYKLSPLTYLLASRMLKVPYIGLPNLLAGKRLVPEYLQHEVTEANLVKEVQTALEKRCDMQEILTEFEAIHRRLAANANQRAATAVLEFAKGQDLSP